MNEGRTDGRRDEGGREGRKGQLRHQIQNGLLRVTCPLAQKSKRHVMRSDDCDVIIAEALNGAEEQKEVWMRMMMMGGICLVLHSGAASFW